MSIKTKENIIERRNTRNKSATKSQIFRFCCSCVRISLIENKRCYFCDSTFILEGKKPLAFFE